MVGGEAAGRAAEGIIVDLARPLLREVAEDIAKDTTRDAAKDAVKDAAKNAAEDAAKDATGDAGRQAAKDAAKDGENTTTKAADRACVGDPIDVATGEVVLGHVDLNLAGVLPLVLERTHLSSYRCGRWFGRSWASTLDQHIEVERDGIYLTSPDGMVLTYPHPQGVRDVVHPLTGPRWPLTREVDGAYVVQDTETGYRLRFAGDGTELPIRAIGDRNGNSIEVRYDAQGAPAEIRHNGGYLVAVDTADGRVTGLRVGETTVVRFGYSAGHLTEVINSSGLPMRFGYDGDGRMTSWTDRNGYFYRYVYDDAGRVVRAEGGDGSLARRLAYGDGTTTVIDSLGHVVHYELNARGRVVAETDALGGRVEREWDTRQRLVAETDQLGHTTRYEYNDAGNTTRLVRADGRAVTAEYDAFGQPVAIGRPDGSVLRYTYDERGNPLSITDPLGATTSFGYDSRGGLVSVTDSDGVTLDIEVDAAGLPLTVTDAVGAVRRYVRDEFGRVRRFIDPLGGVVEYSWDVEGRLTARTMPSGATERWTHDAEGNVIEEVDALGGRTRTEYGAFDLPVGKTLPDGSRLEFTHDTELRLVEVRNSQRASWRYRYDPAGRLVEEVDFNGRTVRYGLDAAGRLVRRTNGAGETIRYVCDPLGNIVRSESDAGTARFDYDAAGLLIHAVNSDAEVTIRRDPLGRVLSETINGRTLTVRYDRAGRRTHLRTPTGAESTWRYDAAGRPQTLHTAGRTLAFHYDAVGREVRRFIDQGAVLDRQWTADHRLAAQTLWGAPTGSGGPRLLEHRAYLYRADGNPLGVKDRFGGERRFDLDPAGRVTAVTADGWTERYAYDSAGNLTHASAPFDADLAGDREVAGTLTRRAANVHYEHDAQGRTVTRHRLTLSGKSRVWRYTWDAADRLIAVTTPEGRQWHYRYDALGRRITKLLLAADGRHLAEQIDFSWDGTSLAEQVHTTWQASGSAVRVTTWTYEPDGRTPLTQTERLPLPDRPQEWYDERFNAIVTDLIGTPTELVDATGAITWRQPTTLWGVSLPQPQGTASCPLRFPGQYHDPETGLHYNLSRYYDPATAAYASPDPLGLAPQPNPHAYVPNPLSWLDPLGLKCTRAEMEAMMKSQKIAPDLLQKGVHFNVGKFELAIHPTSEGGVVLKAVFSSHAGDKGFAAALKKGYEALEYPEFRGWLAKHATAGLQMARQSTHDLTGHGREFKALLKALGGMQ